MTPAARVRLSLVVVAVALVTGGVVWAVTSRSSQPASAPTPAVPALTTTPASTARLRIADLMAQAGCVGSVIGTQLYSYETGRCQIGAAEVTIAVFDTATLRDEWVAAGRQFGGTFVVGVGWAAGCSSPDAATALAAALKGSIL